MLFLITQCKPRITGDSKVYSAPFVDYQSLSKAPIIVIERRAPAEFLDGSTGEFVESLNKMKNGEKISSFAFNPNKLFKEIGSTFLDRGSSFNKNAMRWTLSEFQAFKGRPSAADQVFINMANGLYRNAKDAEDALHSVLKAN